MNISVGIEEKTKGEEIEKLVQAGADEFFCGIMPQEWVNIYGYQISLNRRENPGYHFTTFEGLEKVLKEIHRLKKKLIVTFNAHYYIEEQYKYLKKYLKRLENLGVNGIIVADLGLLLGIKEMDLTLPIHMSGEAAVYNSETLKFYADLGVTRIMFPRHLTIAEIETMVKSSKGLEYEVFIMGERCPFCGAFCEADHGWLPSAFCSLSNLSLRKDLNWDLTRNKSLIAIFSNTRISLEEFDRWNYTHRRYR